MEVLTDIEVDENCLIGMKTLQGGAKLSECLGRVGRVLGEIEEV